MSSTNQLVKWTFPAFALIVGFFWYKRRRVDRADPGGLSKLKSAIDDSKKEEYKRETKEQKTNLNLYDSGIHIDESFTLNSSNQTADEPVCSPRRVSESLDIPSRRSVSQPISMKSAKSSGESQACWYEEVEDIPNPKSVVLGSNPKSANFDMMTRGKPAAIFDAGNATDSKVANKVFDNVTEEEEPTSNGAKTSAIYAIDSRASPVTECSRIDNCAKSLGAVSINDSKSQGQAMSERDSANHSPVSGVLEGSVTDEVRSEGSTDSGKGGSIKGHAKDKSPTTYEFAIPQTLVGKLIGRQGSCLRHINLKAGVNVVVKRHPNSRTTSICEIDGTPEAISVALKIIRQKFPEKKFPNLTLEQVSVLKNPEEISWLSELMHLPLVAGVNNDVIVCHILKPSRLFVQLPTHPTYPSLRILDQNLTQLYDTVESPPVPDELTKGMLVVAKWYDRWARAYVEKPDPSGQQNLVRLVDHGGYWTFSNAEMRKIRSDYLTLPFQAIEVFLANIQPIDGEWKQEAYDVVAQICSGSIGQAQIEGYIDSNVYVSLYINIQKHGVISLADELVARGFAEPVSLEDIVPEEHLPIA